MPLSSCDISPLPLDLEVRSTFIHFAEGDERTQSRARSAPPEFVRTDPLEAAMVTDGPLGTASEGEATTKHGHGGRAGGTSRRHLSKKERQRKRRRETLAAEASVDGFELLDIPSRPVTHEAVSIATPPSEQELDFVYCALPREDTPTELQLASMPDVSEPCEAEEVQCEADSSTPEPRCADSDISSKALMASYLALGGCAIGATMFAMRRVRNRPVSQLRERYASLEANLKSNPMTLLLIGQTGSGKSSFLNLLSNLPLVLQEGTLRQSTIARMSWGYNQDLERAQDDTMESKTSTASSYTIPFNVVTRSQQCDGTDASPTIRVVDTPGFGDTRGVQEDKQHHSDIVWALDESAGINALVLVINGRETRLSPHLRYVLASITSVMPKAILNNLAVVFTNTQTKEQCHFDIRQLDAFVGRNVREKMPVCYIENPVVKIQGAFNDAQKLPADFNAKLLQDDFIIAGDKIHQLLSSICDWSPVSSHTFQDLHRKLSSLELRIMDACASFSSLREVKAQIETKRQEVDVATKTKELNANFSTTTVVEKAKLQKTKGHNTLCGMPGCYKNCHVGCTLRKSLNKNTFKECLAIRWRDGDRRIRTPRQQLKLGNKVPDADVQRLSLQAHNARGDVEGTLEQNVAVGQCFVCGHSYDQHHHEEAMWVVQKLEEELIDPEMRKAFVEAASQRERAETLKRGLVQKQVKVEQEQQDILRNVGGLLAEFDALGVKSSYQKRLEATLVWTEEQLSDVLGGGNEQLRTLHEDLRQRLEIVQTVLTSKL